MPDWDVFISYGNRDVTAKDFARGVTNILSRVGLRVWFYPDCVTGGDDAQQRMEEGLTNSRVVVFLVGPSGVETRSWHEMELHAAQQRWREGRVHLIPVLLPGAHPDRLPVWLKSIDYVAFTNAVFPSLPSSVASVMTRPEDDAALAALLNAISRALGLELYSLAQILQRHLDNLSSFLDEETGAVREEERDGGEPPFLYTEATGFAVLDLLALYDLTQNPSLLERARRAAHWIVTKALDPSGGVKTRDYLVPNDRDLALSFERRRLYTFDTAICLSALLALSRHSPPEETWILEAGQSMARFLSNLIDHTVPAVFDARQDIAEPDTPEKWSERSGAFHTKVAAALLELAEVLPPSSPDAVEYRTKARFLLKKLLLQQNEAGAFETSDGRIELHPLCYAAEGLVFSGRLLRDASLVEAGRTVVSWILKRSAQGEIPQAFDTEGKPLVPDRPTYRVDALAQTLALAVDLDLVDEYSEQLFFIHSVLRAAFVRSLGHHFSYGYYEDGTQARTVSYWTNAFCVQALIKYQVALVLKNAAVVILAAGQGSRCWPLSTEHCPKVFSGVLLGDRSPLQETVRRLRGAVPAKRIFVLTTPAHANLARTQLTAEGLACDNVLVESGPADDPSRRGTIPATLDAIAQLHGRLPRFETLVISMADNIIEPLEAFHGSLYVASLLVADVEGIVSIGKSVDPQAEWDSRFGYMQVLPRNQIEPYNAFRVNYFKEKPLYQKEVAEGQGPWAWECGTLLGKVKYFQALLSKVEGRDLGRDFLAHVGSANIHLSVSLLPKGTRFEDLGVPGPNLLAFWSNRRDTGGNLALGPAAGSARLLCCSDNLLVSDRREIELYGLRSHLVIDSSDANTAIVLPLSKVDTLPTLFSDARLATAARPFVAGGVEAARASAQVAALSYSVTIRPGSEGLIVALDCPDALEVARGENTLEIRNVALPKLARREFEVLAAKQREDFWLAEHLVHVTALALALLEGSVALPGPARDLLSLVCLYHDFGGYLEEKTERRESEIARCFATISKLNRRLLDSRIMLEIFRSEGLENVDEREANLFNDSTNSAVLALRELRNRDARLDRDVRDLLVLLLQIQDVPGQYRVARELVERTKFGCIDQEEDLDTVFACFKIAENFANGRWRWKRARITADFLAGSTSEPLQDIASVVAFTLRWLKEAGIQHLGKYLRAIHGGLSRREPGSFGWVLRELEGEAPRLVCDEFYLGLIAEPAADISALIEMLRKGVSRVKGEGASLRFESDQVKRLAIALSTIEELAGGECPWNQDVIKQVKILCLVMEI